MTDRYIIKVLKGKRIIITEKFNSYNDALESLDNLEEKYGDIYTIEFQDRGAGRRGI